MVDSVNGQNGLLAQRHAILVYENELVNVIHQYHPMVETGHPMTFNVAKSRIVQVNYIEFCFLCRKKLIFGDELKSSRS